MANDFEARVSEADAADNETAARLQVEGARRLQANEQILDEFLGQMGRIGNPGAATLSIIESVRRVIPGERHKSFFGAERKSPDRAIWSDRVISTVTGWGVTVAFRNCAVTTAGDLVVLHRTTPEGSASYRHVGWSEYESMSPNEYSSGVAEGISILRERVEPEVFMATLVEVYRRWRGSAR